MSQGNLSRAPIRYQDFCTIYFALDYFKSGANFESVYCEQGKNDFEIRNGDEFIGYQVKSNPGHLPAKEINNVFRYYHGRSASSGKSQRLFFFIFPTQPSNSLGNLFIIVRDGYGGSTYGKRIKRFIDIALQDIPTDQFRISFRCYSTVEIERLVFSLSNDILKEKTGGSQVVDDETVKSFIGRLRNELDQVAGKATDADRMISAEQLQTLIINFINTYRREELTSSRAGQIKTIVELPEVPYQEMVVEQTTVTKVRIINNETGGSPQE